MVSDLDGDFCKSEEDMSKKNPVSFSSDEKEESAKNDSMDSESKSFESDLSSDDLMDDEDPEAHVH